MSQMTTKTWEIPKTTSRTVQNFKSLGHSRIFILFIFMAIFPQRFKNSYLKFDTKYLNATKHFY